MKAKKVLFIAWDAPHTRYLEGLFTPIFEGLSNLHDYEFHVMQFSWADQNEVNRLANVCRDKGLNYVHVPVSLKPLAFIGKYMTLLRGSSVVGKYIRDHSIDIVMPRSTMPARMILSVPNQSRSFRIIFDADGLPIEERVDFAGLTKGSMRYRALKRIEKKILERADRIITRTHRAISILSTQHGTDKGKFFVVENGRDDQQFRRQDIESSSALRKKLSIPPDALVLAYCGSLGPQYGIDEMLHLHRNLIARGSQSYLLLIATNPEYMRSGIAADLPNVIVTQVPFYEVPLYLSAADVGLAIREPSFSMQGVAPVKLGEYLLTGLPTVASAGIGDTEQLLAERDFVFLLRDHRKENLDKAADWVMGTRMTSELRAAARTYGEQHFGLSSSVESYHRALRDL